MIRTCTTKAGDMWDLISFRAYGSCSHVAKLIKANPDYAGMYLLPAGITLTVPSLTSGDVDAGNVPPWRR